MRAYPPSSFPVQPKALSAGRGTATGSLSGAAAGRGTAPPFGSSDADAAQCCSDVQYTECTEHALSTAVGLSPSPITVGDPARPAWYGDRSLKGPFDTAYQSELSRRWAASVAHIIAAGTETGAVLETLQHDDPTKPAHELWAEQGDWHRRRALGARRDRRDRADECGDTWMVLGLDCARDPRAQLVPRLCRQRDICTDCLTSYWARVRGRIREGLQHAHHRALPAWRTAGRPMHLCRDAECGACAPRRAPGARPLPPRWTLITLTSPREHAGRALHVGERRDWIQHGLTALRQGLHDRLGYAPEYVYTWEATPGTDGLGHPHVHLAVALPYVCYASLRRLWARALGVPADEAHIDIDGREAQHGAAYGYIAKYMAKGLPSDMAPGVAGGWLAAQWGRRRFSGSRGTVPGQAPAHCGCCGVVWEMVLPSTPSAGVASDAAAHWVTAHGEGCELEARRPPRAPPPGSGAVPFGASVAQ